MNRGALIGGAVLLAALIGFTGLYIVMASAPDPIEDTRVAVPTPKGLSIGLPKGAPKVPVGSEAAKGIPEGDVPDAQGRTKRVDITTRPKAERLDAKRWEELRLKQANEKQAKAMGVVSEFVGGQSDENAATVREVFFHLFDTSAAIREDIKAGAISSADGRAELGELRSNTVKELSDVLGPKDYALLQRELRSSDALVF